MKGSRGQSSVELVGLVPLLLAVGLGVYSFLSAGAAEQAAGGAAEAGAVALLQGRDARVAARRALTDWPRRRTSISVRGRRVTVRVTPRGPLGERLRQMATADAGPSQSERSRTADPGSRQPDTARSGARRRPSGGP
jgi:hypothetical protein